MAGISLKNLAAALNRVDRIITPKLIPFLIERGDAAYPDWVVDRIAALLRTEPRNRVGTFSGSSAGHCLRQQELSFLGLPQGAIDPQLQNIFNDGKWRHLRWQATLLTAGIVDDIEYPLPWPAMRGQGSVDAVGEVPYDHPQRRWHGMSFGLELKGVSTFQFAKYEESGPLERHRQQVHRYFLSGGFDLFVIVYEDKTTQNWCEWVIEPDKKLLAESRSELESLNRAIDDKKLHKMLLSCKQQAGTEWRECPYGAMSKICPKSGTWPRLNAKVRGARG